MKKEDYFNKDNIFIDHNYEPFILLHHLYFCVEFGTLYEYYNGNNKLDLNSENLDNEISQMFGGMFDSQKYAKRLFKAVEKMESNNFELFDSIPEHGNLTEFVYNELIDLEIYFYGCPISVYKETYPSRLNSYLRCEIDSQEIDFIKHELSIGILHHGLYTFDRELSHRPLYLIKNTHLLSRHSLERRFDFLQNKALVLGYSIDTYEQVYEYDAFDSYTISEIKNTPQPPETSIPSKIKWVSGKIDFLELTKALIENESIKGTQTDIIKTLSQILNIKIDYPDQNISKLKLRDSNNSTPFLDKLKTSLIDHLSK